MLTFEPEGCFAIEADGAVVATTTLFSYGTVSWLGMVLTHPNYRRRGLARRLIEHALEYARMLRVDTIKLDATAEGRPLYESFGFRVEQPVERWLGFGGSVGRADDRMVSSANLLRLDALACGYDRSVLLERLAKTSRTVIDPGGYAMSRPGRLNHYIGPCVATNPDTARHLIGQTISDTQTEWFWDLLPENEEAVKLARHFGFGPDRILTRMVWGKPCRGNEAHIYAIAGFEFG